MGNQRSTSRANGKSCTYVELCLESAPCKLQVPCLTGNVKTECENHYVITETAGLERKLCILVQSASPLVKLLMCNWCVSVSSWPRNWSWVCSLLRQNFALSLWKCEYTLSVRGAQKRCSSYSSFRSYTATACEPEAVLKLLRIYRTGCRICRTGCRIYRTGCRIYWTGCRIFSTCSVMQIVQLNV